MSDHLERLLAAWQSDELTAAEAEEFIAALETSAELRTQFAQRVAMHGKLRAVLSGQPRWRELEKLISGTADAEIRDNGVEIRVMSLLAELPRAEPKSASLQKRAQSGKVALQSLLVAGLAVLAGTVVSWFWLFESPPARQRIVVGNADPLDGDVAAAPVAGRTIDGIAVVAQVYRGLMASESDSLLRRNQFLESGWYTLPSGMVQLDFVSGVQMIVRGPARFELRNPFEVFFETGECTCTVSEVGQGFRVISAGMEVVDRGTVFAFSTTADQHDEVHVIEGKVEVRTPQQADVTEVTASDAVSRSGDRIVPIPYRAATFPQAAELEELRRSESDSVARKWQSASVELAADPDTLIYYTFEDLPAGGSETQNLATSPQRGTDGAILGCQFVEGRWAKKRAIKFERDQDRVLFRLAGQHDTVTMLASVRVTALVNQGNARVMSGKYTRWSAVAGRNSEEERHAIENLAAHGNKNTRWIIHRDGTPEINLELLDDGDTYRWDRYTAEQPVVASPVWGEWVQLAVVYDSPRQRVSHYMNGWLVSEHKLVESRPISLEYSEIGNLIVNPREREIGIDYRLFGEMDEFLVSGRVYSGDELRAIWKAAQAGS